MSRLVQRQTKAILTAKAATGTGESINVEDFTNIVLAFSSDTSANGTVKFQGSVSDSAPTFSSAQSTANHWDYVQTKDLEDGSTIDGDTGIALAGTDDVRLVEVNTNLLKWITATVTARSAGSFTVVAKMSGE